MGKLKCLALALTTSLFDAMAKAMKKAAAAAPAAAKPAKKAMKAKAMKAKAMRPRPSEAPLSRVRSTWCATHSCGACSQKGNLRLQLQEPVLQVRVHQMLVRKLSTTISLNI